MITPSSHGRKNPRAGFSLVEVSLALLVAGIGLMSIFALFPSGLDAARVSTADVRAAQFAESAFASLRAESTPANWNGLQGATLAPLDPAQTLRAHRTAIFRYEFSYLDGGGTRITDHILRYRLRLERAIINPNLWWAVLHIWDGDGSLTATDINGRHDHVFYTQLFNWNAP